LVWPEEEGDDVRACRYRVVLANLGDSRGLVVRFSDGRLLGETADHKPDLPEESSRIRAAGGIVTKASLKLGPARVDGDLALSRAFGDFRLKDNRELAPEQQKVCCVPDTYEFECCCDDFIVLACDGVFDVMTSEEVARHVHESIRSGGHMAAAAKVVVAEALRRRSMDNVTCVIAQIFEGIDEEL